MSFTLGLVCTLGVGPDRGGRERNEDNYLVCRDGRATWRAGTDECVQEVEGQGLLLAVCDGMGGHEDGAVAATTAARVLAHLYQPRAPAEPSRVLRRYVLDAHLRLHHKARSQGPVTMGTTLSALWILGGRASWVQVGDSRIYLLRDDRLRQITPDHTRNEFLRRDGRPPLPRGDHLAQSFIFGSRGLGDDASLRLEPGLDANTFTLEQGDRLLLCTDGLWASVDDLGVGEVLRHTPEPQAAAVALVDRALARGSTDNLTALVVRVDEKPVAGEGELPPLEEDRTDPHLW